MPATAAKKPSPRRTAAPQPAVVRTTIVPNFANLQHLMEMQNRMTVLSAKLPRKSLFDGIPAGASPYYFYSMAERKE